MSLAQLLADLRIADSRWGRIHFWRAGGARFSSARTGYVHLVASGALQLHAPGLREPVDLAEGAAAFVIGARTHSLLCSRQAVPRDLDYFQLSAPRDHIGIIRTGDAAGSLVATTLTGAFDLDPLTLSRVKRLVPGAMTGQALILSLDDIGRSAKPRWLEEAEGSGGAEYLDRLADLLLLQAMRRHLASSGDPSVRDARSRRLPPKLLAAVALMHRFPGHPWSLATLAERANMSRSTFAAAFTAGMGQPAMQFLTRLRMERARELLTDTDLPLAQVCTSVGFRSIPSFSRLFKSHYGVPPAKFRAARGAASASLPLTAGDHWAPFS